MGLKDLFAAHSGNDVVKTHTIEVEGMHCGACERLVADALEAKGASNVVANHETGVVSYEGELDDTSIASAIAEAGFTLVS